jgi:hypothetical protein
MPGRILFAGAAPEFWKGFSDIAGLQIDPERSTDRSRSVWKVEVIFGHHQPDESAAFIGIPVAPAAGVWTRYLNR